MTYAISYGYCLNTTRTVETLDAAIIVALTVIHNRPANPLWSYPMIVNLDRYDCDDGREISGLDEDERDRVMSAGL